MKRLFLLIFLITTLFSQSKAQNVIASAGDFNTTTTGSLSWTIGEVITETFSTGLNSLTQGFNQSQLSATATFELPGLNFNLNAFPNPTSDFLIIETDRVEKMEYLVFNQQGKLILQSELSGFQTKIDFKTLIPAIYIIKIVENNIPLKQFKIVKQ